MTFAGSTGSKKSGVNYHRLKAVIGTVLVLILAQQGAEGDARTVENPVCPDPAVVRIDFSLVSKRGPFQGRVKIEGVVRNVGPSAYFAAPMNPVLELYENGRLISQAPFGGIYGRHTECLGPKVLPQFDCFRVLSPGQESSVVYERDWDALGVTPGTGFPVTYQVRIKYAGNVHGWLSTEDCDPSNNVMERNGADINKLFPRPGMQQPMQPQAPAPRP
jgi:hypothetical protein